MSALDEQRPKVWIAFLGDVQLRLTASGVAACRFPAPVRLGPRTVAWVRSEIREWAAERVLKSRSTDLIPGSKKVPRPALREAWAPSKKWA
jgi:prophage regulatory protein